jgi:NifU-like protein involved in Fe-S cluster formation
VKYSELTRRYFEAAHGAGELAGADVFRGSAGRRAQGTWVQYDVQVSCATIRAARFLAFGCPHTIAAASWVAERAGGPAFPAALPESIAALSERFAVPVEKRGRLLVIEDAWLAALRAAAQYSAPLSPRL